MTDCVGVDVKQYSPACAEPSKMYPKGRTGTVAGCGVHQRAGEKPCLACAEAFRSHKQKPSPDGAPACARPTNKYPGGRTGTSAGYLAHRRTGEEACDLCTAAHSTKGMERKRSLDEVALAREKRIISRNAQRRIEQKRGWASACGNGDRGTVHGYFLHLEAQQTPCSQCYMAAKSISPACRVPTLKYPHGRMGTVVGYAAHHQVGEPACGACLDAIAQAAGEARETDPLLQMRSALWTKYRMRIEDYNRMLAEQGGGCAVCGSEDAGDVRTGRFHVDHDHSCCPGKDRTCGKCVRGLLCRGCNTGLGNFADDPDRLSSALIYLMRRRNVLMEVKADGMDRPRGGTSPEAASARDGAS